MIYKIEGSPLDCSLCFVSCQDDRPAPGAVHTIPHVGKKLHVLHVRVAMVQHRKVWFCSFCINFWTEEVAEVVAAAFYVLLRRSWTQTY